MYCESCKYEGIICVDCHTVDGVPNLYEPKGRIDTHPVVHGVNLNAEWPSLFECSICHWSCWDTYCGDTDKYNYCPNCGAKMDGDA